MVMATGSSTPHTLLSRIFSRAELQTAISATSGITSKLRRIAVNFGRTNTADKEKANDTKLAVKMTDEPIGRGSTMKQMPRGGL
jgi:hypothetical protein